VRENGAIMSANKQEKVAEVANTNWRKRCDNEVQSEKALQHFSAHTNWTNK